MFLLIAGSLFGLTACKEDDELFVLRNTDALTFGYEASSQTFTICTNGNWSVHNDGAAWIALHPASGAGDGETRTPVTVSVDRNTGATRTARIAIQAAEREIYISVSQEEGFLTFGTPSLSGSLVANEAIDGVNLRIPYSRATGSEQFAVSVQLSGTAAAGIQPVTNHPVTLTAASGMIYIPLSGVPAAAGEVRFDITTTSGGLPVAALVETVGSEKVSHGADFVISGYLADPDGTDSPVIGAVSGGGFSHTGGYEYVQLLALKDIDFAQTHYCLVTCINGNQETPGDKGWAAGSAGTKQTYQINIDQGAVTKGSYFYVGGISRLLDSYPSSGTEASPTVDAAKWPIAINYYTLPGANGNGLAVGSSGILGNWATYPANVADGIAVFRGTTVDENSVPMDAVFYGTAVLTKPVFRVPDNDHYSRFDASGAPQPCFGQGANTWMVAAVPPANDDGYFTALGGEVSSTEWITPRTGTYIQMKKSAGVTHSTADIEGVNGSTKFVDK
jgi:hypothetical protein